jgi:hypothetical protein
MKFKITNFRCRGEFKLLQFFNLLYSQLLIWVVINPSTTLKVTVTLSVVEGCFIHSLIAQFVIDNHCNNIFQR